MKPPPLRAPFGGAKDVSRSRGTEGTKGTGGWDTVDFARKVLVFFYSHSFSKSWISKSIAIFTKFIVDFHIIYIHIKCNYQKRTVICPIYISNCLCFSLCLTFFTTVCFYCPPVFSLCPRGPRSHHPSCPLTRCWVAWDDTWTKRP